MDGGPRLSGESAAACSSASSSGSRTSRPRKGIRLRLLRRRRGPAPAMASRGGDGGENGGGAAQDDLALPLGMSFAAVLARIMNSSNDSGERLHPVILSKICTSAVKESLENSYGDRFDSFMRNFENSFSSTLRTLHRINEIPVYERSPTPEYSFKHGGSAAVGNSSAIDLQNHTKEIELDLMNSVDNLFFMQETINSWLIVLIEDPLVKLIGAFSVLLRDL